MTMNGMRPKRGDGSGAMANDQEWQEFKRQQRLTEALHEPVLPVTLIQRIYRIRCWWRDYHCDTPDIGRFRYDVDGNCCYCGKVGTGRR